MNDPQPLPDWSDFGGYLRKGFMLFLAMLIYSLPVALLSFLAYLPMMASNENNVGLMSILSIICSCVIILLGFAVGILMLVGIVRYAESDNFSDFFAFSDNFRMLKENLGDFGMALLYLIGFSLLVGLVSGITFGLGSIVAIPLTATFTGHLYGQLARKLSNQSAPMV